MEGENFKAVRLWIYIFGLCTTLILSTSCSREENGSSSNLTMKLPSSLSKVGSNHKTTVPSGYFPMHLVANVHYDGKVEIDHWDCEFAKGDNGDPSLCEFPEIINFGGKDFPVGSDRIIQVLLVYGNEQQNLIFGYDDAIKVELFLSR